MHAAAIYYMTIRLLRNSLHSLHSTVAAHDKCHEVRAGNEELCNGNPARMCLWSSELGYRKKKKKIPHSLIKILPARVCLRECVRLADYLQRNVSCTIWRAAAAVCVCVPMPVPSPHSQTKQTGGELARQQGARRINTWCHKMFILERAAVMLWLTRWKGWWSVSLSREKCPPSKCESTLQIRPMIRLNDFSKNEAFLKRLTCNRL